LPESLQKRDVEWYVKDSEERTIIIKDLTKQFANNFNLLHSKEKKGHKYNATHKEETMTNGVVLNVLSNEETKDATSFSEEDEEEILIVTERDIHEFKDK
jgi:peroxiredoxin